MKKFNSFRKMTILFLTLVGTGWCVNASAQRDWTQLEPYSKPRMALVSCAKGQNIYIFGGWTTPVVPLADGEIYNTASGTNTPIANMSVGLAFPSANILNNRIFIIGGFIDNDNASKLVQEYDPENDSWMLKQELPHEIGHHVSGVIDGKIYLAGGLHKGSVETDFRESISLVYDPGSDQWDTLAPMNSTLKTIRRNSGRIQASSCVYQGKLYVFGGFRFDSPDQSYLPVPEVYDPDKDTWTDLAEMILPLAHHTSVVYKDKIYLLGGSTSSDYNTGEFTPSNRVFEYDPELNSWQEKDTMPVGLAATEGHVINDYLYLIGGDDDPNIGGEGSGQVWRVHMDLVTSIERYHESLITLQNQPNPFIDHTAISYELKEGGAVKLEVFDILGRSTLTLVDEEQIPGKYTYTWSALNDKPGIYFCRLSMEGSGHAIKLVKQ